MSNLRIGVPSKGRLSELAGELLKQAGLSFRRQERSLFARVGEMPIDITFLRTDDIPVLCAEGAIDMGITGSDLVAEAGADVLTRLELGVGRVQAGPLRARRFGRSPARRSCTASASPPAFPTSRSSYLREHKADVHLVNLGGSVEIMITLGVADAIVDLVETGSTLAANRLRVLDRNRPLRDGADPEQGQPRQPSWPTASSAGWKASSSPAASRCWNTTSPAPSWPKPRKSRPASTAPRSTRWKTPPGAPSA